MKVGEFQQKFACNFRYQSDKHIVRKYWETELMAWVVAGTPNRKTYAFVFRSARQTMSFVNNMRAPLRDAFEVIQNAKIERDDKELEEIKRLVLMESL